MKYIKFFEGFESSVISKTLSYIKDKKGFISELKKICDFYDVELSKLSDDMFKYLPLNKAFKYHSTSDSSDGSNELKSIKFWFDVDGNKVTTTGDSSRHFVREVNQRESIDLFKNHQNIEDYDIVRRLTIEELSKCKNGTPICFLSSLPGYEDSVPVVSWFFRKGTTNYLLQNHFNDIRASRTCGLDYHIVAKHICAVNSESDYKSMLLELSLKTDTVIEYNYNIDLEWFNSGKDLRMAKYISTTSADSIKNKSDFAIILDIDKLKNSNKLSKKKSDRVESKKDASSFLKNEDIKNANIERYLNKIIDNVDLDVVKVSNIISRLFDRDFFVYLLFTAKSDAKGRDYNLSITLAKLIDSYYEALKREDVKKLKVLIKDEIERYSFIKKLSRERMSWLINEIEVGTNTRIGNTAKELSLEIINEVKNLNNIIYDKLDIKNLETIDDLEVLLQKVKMIKEMLKSSRYGLSNLSCYFFEYFTSSEANAITTITSNRHMNENQLDNIKRFKNIMSRL